MKYKVLVYTTQNWKTHKQKHARIIDLMMSGGAFEEVTFDIKKWTGGKPVLDGNRPDATWFETNLSGPAKVQGYNHVIFHFGMTEGLRWGIDSGVRGVNLGDSDYFGESWVRSDENSIVRFNDGTSRDRYEKSVPHEIGHELKNQKLTDMDIHQYDFKNEINNIEGFYKNLKLGSQIPSLWGRIADMLLSLKKKLTNPYDQPLPAYWSKPSQAYGVANSAWYPLTGHHIGTDFATPVGTPVIAPIDCTVTRSGYLPKSLGYWCEVKLDGWYMIVCHLESEPEHGNYKRGAVIAYTGDTGFIKGVHCHIEGWKEPMDRSKLNKDNWNILTFDVTTKIK